MKKRLHSKEKENNTKGDPDYWNNWKPSDRAWNSKPILWLVFLKPKINNASINNAKSNKQKIVSNACNIINPFNAYKCKCNEHDNKHSKNGCSSSWMHD